VVLVLWAPQAIEDVLRITNYVAKENPVAALRIVRELVAAADNLETSRSAAARSLLRAGVSL